MGMIAELYGQSAEAIDVDWVALCKEQNCPFLRRRCIKVRKSSPELTIGTCTVIYGKESRPIVICPHRLLENNQIFIDCLHLLTLHEPGNQLHIVPEITLPGGSVDYFLASVNQGKVRDFVGIELQTLDTTGTVWPFRQRFLRAKGLAVREEDAESEKTFGMNWKMTAKTILIQLHHKVQSFEHLNKHMVLVIQDFFLDYVRSQFQFDHLAEARQGHSIHFHSYSLERHPDAQYSLVFRSRMSTDANGIATSLGLYENPNVELQQLMTQIESKLSPRTLFRPV